jgi:hypothetical protein
MSVYVEFSMTSARDAPRKLRILPHFLSHVRRMNAELPPYVLVAGKPVEAVKRLTFERETGHVESEPRIMPGMRRPHPSSQTGALIAIILPAI